MSIPIGEVLAVANRYLTRFPEERGDLRLLLQAIDEEYDLTSRREFRGHVTCGVVIIDERWRVLHVEHRVLGRWLLPGGHVDHGDSSLLDAALRELQEEPALVLMLSRVYLNLTPNPL